MDLKAIYLTALEDCAPGVLVRPHIDPALPRNVVAIGKCAGPLLDGVARMIEIDHAFAAIPAGYALPHSAAEIHIGGHPEMTPDSFTAGRALVRFVDAHQDILFLVSGGGSACVEVALPPFDEKEVSKRNSRLIASGLPIGAINQQRIATSAIKGGKLGLRVRGRRITLVYSDVSTGALPDVASGPSILPDDAPILIADNRTLTAAAVRLAGSNGVYWPNQIECDVATAARLLVECANSLEPGQVLVAGGEPTTVVRGDGIGGRCSELAVHFALQATRHPIEALFAGSDGVDGNSGSAGIHLRAGRPALDQSAARAALGRSNSFPIASLVGEPIMIAPTGNNLRDLFLVARD